jgi:cell wall-associated NlpC family hydrolase
MRHSSSEGYSSEHTVGKEPGNGKGETGNGAATAASPFRFLFLSSRILTASVVAAVLPLTALAQPSSMPSAGTDSTTTAEARGGFAIFGGSAAIVRDSLVTLARQQLGRRYVFGGTSPDKGFDCSGLIRYVLAKLDIKVPRTAAQQERLGETVAKDTAELQPGDLVTFGRGSRATHIGIYVGEGRFIHASSAAGRVVESRLIRPPARLIKPWRGARRILAGADSTMAVTSAGTEG